MYGIHDLGQYLVGLVAIILLPGPNSMYVLSVAAKHGVKAGYRGACGIFLGDTILMVLASTGVASILKTIPSVFIVLKILGALYLSWLGLNLLRAAWLKRQQSASSLMPTALTVVSERSLGAPFKKALIISLLNPKAILFFVAFFIQFVDPHYPYPVLSFAILGGLCQLASFLYLTALIVSGAKLASAFSRRRTLSMCLTGCVGFLFLGFAAKLATASLES